MVLFMTETWVQDSLLCSVVGMLASAFVDGF